MTIKDKQFEPYLSQKELSFYIDKIGKQINKDYADKEPTFLVILKGSFMFASDLIKHFKGHCKVRFMGLASYEGTTSTHNIKIYLEPKINEGEDLIVVEDIVDTGNTLEFIYKYLDSKNIKSKRIASLFFKPDVYNKNYSLDYIGKSIPNKFIVGYGLDYDGFGRNLPDVYQLKTN